MVVQDPNFWRRFSTAVHQDDAEKSLEAQSGTSSLKHAYVSTATNTTTTTPKTIPTTTTAARTSTPCTPLSPSFSINSGSPLHRDAVPYPAPAHTHTHPYTPPPPERSSKSMSFISQSISFTGGPLTGPPSPYKFASSPSSPQRRGAKRTSRRISGFTRHVNASSLSFGALAGRRGSQFRFCTTITADGTSSDSWLVSQKKKQRQRAWMCWAFWITLAAVVAGVVVAVLLLKAKGII